MASNFIGPNCLIGPNVEMGQNIRIEGLASIGMAGESRGFMLDPPGKVIIADDCIIREFVAISGGTAGPTVIGRGCLLLKGCYIGHDCILNDRVTISPHAALGGFVVVGGWANVGMGAVIHQKVKIPPGAMIGMGAVVTKRTVMEPFGVYVGNPAKFIKFNETGFMRSGLSEKQLKAIKETWL